MTINWKVRMRNKTFWLTFVPAAILVAEAILQVLGFDVTLDRFSEQAVELINAVFGLLALVGVAADPTTSGVSDSSRAMLYEYPAGSCVDEVYTGD